MASASSIQVLCVDKDDAHRASLRSLIDNINGIELVAEAATPATALQQLNEHNVDVVLMDLCSHDLDGNELTRQIRSAHNKVRVLISTASDSPDDIFSAMDAGADGYLLKGNLIERRLQSAISSVRLGAVWLDPDIAKQVLWCVENASTLSKTRILSTGLLPIPLLPDEQHKLSEISGSNCVDGVCMVDPSFVKKLRRFGQSQA